MLTEKAWYGRRRGGGGKGNVKGKVKVKIFDSKDTPVGR
jgi:hypothetical protein